MTDQRPLLPVTQSDRDAAAAWTKSNSRHAQAANMRRGSCDAAPLVQAFARHRLTAEQDGWVRVPVTLTDEMVSAWNDADPAPYLDGSDDATVNRAWAQAEWSAMIAAAQPETVSAEQDGWQPIESAPKDGRKIIVTRSSATGVNPAKIVWWAASRPVGWRWRALRTLRYEPTHWRALPTPPANILDSTKEAGHAQ